MPNQPHDGIWTKFLDDRHSGNAENAVDDVNDAVKGSNIWLNDGGIDATALDRDGDVVIWTVGGEI